MLVAIAAGCQYLFKDVYGNKPSGMERWLTGVSHSSDGHLIQRKLDMVGNWDAVPTILTCSSRSLFPRWRNRQARS